MKRSQPMRRTPIRRGTKRLRSRGPKMTPIRKSAKGEDCAIGLHLVCNRDSSTVVLCHENSYEAGKGMGLKSRDTEAAYGCSACHDVYDRRVPLPEWLTWEMVDACFQAGKRRTLAKLRAKGLA